MTTDHAPGGADEIAQALQPVAAQLQADGYELRTELLDDHRIRLTVLAGPDACEECLVPKAIMTQVVARALAGHPADGIELVYPREATDAQT